MSLSNSIYIALAVGALLFFALLSQLGYKNALRKKENGVYEVKTLPSTLVLFLNVVSRLFSKPIRSTLSPLRFEMNGVTVSESHVSSYTKVCGFSNSQNVPITYPQLLGFRLQLLLFLDDHFPFKAMGLVHISNRIKQFTYLSVGMKVNIVVRCGDELIPHPKGYCFDIICEVYSTDSSKLLWESSSIYLCRKKHKTEPTADSLYKSEIAESQMQGLTELDDAPWKLKGDLGRRYASVSEDYNPIHMFAATAALFGFPKGCIAHGLWTSARTMATLDKSGEVSNKCNASKGQYVEYYTEFKLPIFLPSSVVLMGSEQFDKDGSKFFQVMSAKDRTIPHMKGSLKVQLKK